MTDYIVGLKVTNDKYATGINPIYIELFALRAPKQVVLTTVQHKLLELSEHLPSYIIVDNVNRSTGEINITFIDETMEKLLLQLREAHVAKVITDYQIITMEAAILAEFPKGSIHITNGPFFIQAIGAREPIFTVQ